MTSITASSLVSSLTSSAVASTSSSVNRVAPQGGIFEPDANPSRYDSNNPIIVFIIQAGIIIIFCRALHYPLQYLHQPRVIAEVIGGILLGPSVMGQIPGFTDTIFPAASKPNLNLVANLGLVLFLFLVGLEVDLRYLIGNWRVALSVGLAGMALPFGLGCAIAWGLYNEFRDEPGVVEIDFGVYMLFVGVAMAITAFPVLCRILTELKLLGTSVGVIVLSAGVGNDVVGWILLALCVALVNANSGLTAVWVLLTALGYAIFLALVVRPLFKKFLWYTGSLTDGPTQGVVALTLLLALASAFFTAIIGVHAIFGAFMVGIICPHEGGFAIKLTEKIEDLISALFLPLYFALSGLSTDLGLLNSGITWAYVVGVISVAFFGKITGAALAAKINGLVWRESFAIGALMSCKGLVELIVLNIGLQAKILSERTFTIFVVMALITTFATTPLTDALYPVWYQKKLESWKRGEIDWETGSPIRREQPSPDSVTFEKLQRDRISRVVFYLRLDTMPATLAFSSLLSGNPKATAGRVHPAKAAEVQDNPPKTPEQYEKPTRPIQTHGVRLLELTDRNSSVMQVSETNSYSLHDPIVNTFCTFGILHNLSVSGEVSVVPQSSFSETLLRKASEISSDLLLLPWSETGGMSEAQILDSDFSSNKIANTAYEAFVADTLSHATNVSTAVFINNNFGGTGGLVGEKKHILKLSYSVPSLHSSSLEHETHAPVADKSHHIFLPFFGGPDDRVALRLVLQMAECPDVTATVVFFEAPTDYFQLHGETSGGAGPSSPISVTFQSRQDDTISKSGSSVRGATATTTEAIPRDRDHDLALFASLSQSIPAHLVPRILFETVRTEHPVAEALERASKEVGRRPRNAGDLVVVGRSLGAREAFAREVGFAIAPAEARTLGLVAGTLVKAGVGGSLLVVKSGGREVC